MPEGLTMCTEADLASHDEFVICTYDTCYCYISVGRTRWHSFISMFQKKSPPGYGSEQKPAERRSPITLPNSSDAKSVQDGPRASSRRSSEDGKASPCNDRLREISSTVTHCRCTCLTQTRAFASSTIARRRLLVVSGSATPRTFVCAQL
jgi:hypothetical protein